MQSKTKNRLLSYPLRAVSFFLVCIGLSCAGGYRAYADEPNVYAVSLEQTVLQALDANIGLQESREDRLATESAMRMQRTRQWPTFSTAYQYQRTDEETMTAAGVSLPRDQYLFKLSVTQPIFAGFSIVNSIHIAQLGADMADINEQLTKESVIYNTTAAFFRVLKMEKLLIVARESVKQLTAHKEVAENFFKVGMIPLNDLLKSQVELANAAQDMLVAHNNLEIARSELNMILKRPVNAPVVLEDSLNYNAFPNTLNQCLHTASLNRQEIRQADLFIEKSEKEIRVAQKDYFPAVNCIGTYYRRGDGPEADGFFEGDDPDGWDVTIAASWNFWEWNRTRHAVSEKAHRYAQAGLRKERIMDQIQFEVKTTYLKIRETEKNIGTSREAVAQARENFRISEEQYREQVAASTDVLDAQTLLSKTMTNYYNALYDYQIARAAIRLAMGEADRSR